MTVLCDFELNLNEILSEKSFKKSFRYSKRQKGNSYHSSMPISISRKLSDGQTLTKTLGLWGMIKFLFMISGLKGVRRSGDTTGLYFLIYFPEDRQLYPVINKLASSETLNTHTTKNTKELG